MAKLSDSELKTAPGRSEEYEVDLKMVLNLIKHSYKLILIIASIFLFLGIYYANTRPPVYRSTAMIEVRGSGVGGIAGGGAVGAVMALRGQTFSSVDVEKILLQTPYLLSEVVRQLKLDISVSPHYLGYFAEKWASFKNQNRGSVSVSFLRVPNELLSKQITLTVGNNGQYSLSTSSGKTILNGMVGQLMSSTYFSQPLQIQVNNINAKAGAQFDVSKQAIPDVVDGVARSMSILEEGDQTGILKLQYISGNREQAQQFLNTILAVAVDKNKKEKLQEAIQTLHFIDHQLPKSKSDLEKAEVKLDSYSVKTGIFSIRENGKQLEQKIDGLQNVLQKLKFKKMVLLQKYTSLHPAVVAITQKENNVRLQISNVKAELNKLPSTGEKEIGMQRNAKTQTEVYTALEKSAQQMEMMKASTVSSVQILSSASYPVSRIPVKKAEIIFASTLLGLMISLGIIFIKHALSPFIEDPDEVERRLGIPVAAIIPCSEKQASYNRKISRDKLYASTNPFLLARENPNDVSIESLRSLRTTIQMALLEAKNNVIAITGCSPSSGKSFISSNLAVLLSNLEKKVLIIDSDMRLGKLSQCFGKTKTPGLSTYLKNEATLDQVIQNVIPEKLDFIATGLYPENPAELLFQKALIDLIQLASDRYDLVVIDTPPILAVTDPALILRYSAINLMVLSIGKDQMKEVMHAKNILEKGGVTLTGVVFNTTKQQKSGFGYNYGYANYHYTYGK